MFLSIVNNQGDQYKLYACVYVPVHNYALSHFTALGNKLFGVPEIFQVEVARANTILDQER